MRNYLVTIHTSEHPPQTISLAQYFYDENEQEVYPFAHITIKDPKSLRTVYNINIEQGTIKLTDLKGTTQEIVL